MQIPETQVAPEVTQEVTPDVTTDVAPEVTSEPEPQLPSDVPAFEMPEKFKDKSAEEIAKAYMELEKLQSKKPEEVTDEVKPAPVATQALLDEYIAKAAENGGDLSDEHYAELAEKGFDKPIVDRYVKGIKAEQAENANRLLETAGTDAKSFNDAVLWARENMSPERIERYNKALESADEAVVISTIESIMDSYMNNSSAPTPPIHTSGVSTPARGYANEGEMYKDMADPRYTTDRAYYMAVRKKVEATTAF